MKSLTVKSLRGSYKILIGRNLLQSVGPLIKSLGLGRKILIVTNGKLAPLFLKPVKHSLENAGFEVISHLLPYTDERNKSVSVLEKLWSVMTIAGLDRSSALLALGGGTIGDLCGFAASTYMRGIALIQVPTTLLAQVDSAIGGKTAVNLPIAKNIVGTFYPPRLVISDAWTLKSLSATEFGNQFAEIVKYGVIQDPKLFRILETNLGEFFKAVRTRKIGSKEMKFLTDVIFRSACVKAYVVSHDEFETKGLRMILNYGHTFAHGFETASRYKMPHGHAVALGMLCASQLACRLGLLSQKELERQTNLLKKLGFALSLSKAKLRISDILVAMQRDKKVTQGVMRFVLPVRIGKVVVKRGIPAVPVKKILRGIGGK